MPILEKYRHYFNIDPEYLPAVNKAVIEKNPDMWKKFFPHETFVKLIKDTVSVLNRKQKLSIWVEGAYGTGKSHAVLTLKKLLDVNDEETRAYFQKYQMDNDLCNSFQNIKNSGKILTVHRYGSSSIHGDNDLVLAIQESIEDAFTENGIENKGSNSLRESMIRYLSDPENKESFSVYVKGSYSDLFGGDDVDVIIEKLRTYSDLALQGMMEKIFKVANERNIRAFTMTTTDLANWIKEIIKANNLKAIVFIWDEFTEYFYNNARNLTGFQELCEISETDPFYFMIVTHVSSGLFHDKDQDFIKLNGRFLNPHSLISLPENIAFQLMGAAMEKNKDATVLEDWKDVTNDLSDRTKESRQLVKKIARIDDNELKGILPIHPFTALLLKHISSAFDSNQRSMFDFIKNDRGDEIKGFQWFIDNYGPDDVNPLLTIDMLWEFFYDKGKDYLAHDIRAVLDYYSRNSNQKLDADEKRILKTVLLLQAISQHAGDSVELFIPNDRNIDNAFEGSDMDSGRASRCAEKLVRDKVLFKKQIGNGKFQYNAYVNEVSGVELDALKTEIDKKTTSSLIMNKLSDDTCVADAIMLSGALKLRYVISCVSSSDFDYKIKQLRNKEANYTNNIMAVICFAKDDNESVVLGKKICNALNDGSYNMVFIDATRTPFGNDRYNQYRDDMAQSMYQQGKDNTLADQYGNNAKDSLKKWKSSIISGEFIVFTSEKPTGERATTLDALYNMLEKINKSKFPECLEATYNVLPTMFISSSLKLGVECGASENTRQMFSSSNPETKLEVALEGAWKTEKYWEIHPSLLISKIKLHVNKIIQHGFDNGGRISIRDIYDSLAETPYGFMPCNLSAFVLGFVLKEYTDGSYSWSDNLTNDILDINKLKEMIAEVITLQITPNARYKDKYIVAMTEDEKSFNEATSIAFDVQRNLCTSVEQTRERIRNKMKDLTFPIWTLKSIVEKISIKTDQSVIKSLIDLYCVIANNGNSPSGQSDNDIALSIGKLCRENKYAAEDMKSLLSKEKCTEGMSAYLKEFEDGMLIDLAKEIGDNGQYINVLRKKFDADEANWVWSVDTAQQKIYEVILEYKIIKESNKIISKNTSFENTIHEWCEKCNYIRISYAASKNYLDEAEPFLEILYEIKKAGTILDSQKQLFYELLTVNSEKFRYFYENQIDVFKRVCANYLTDFTDEEIKELYQTISSGTFTCEKSEYLSLVDKKVDEFKNSLGNQQLKKLWYDKTGTTTPRIWSKEHKMPILCLISDQDIQIARSVFDTINQNHPGSESIDTAIDFLESATFFDALNDEVTLDKAFKANIVKSFDVMLTNIQEIKEYLASHITAEPYDWFGLPEVDKKLQQMAEKKYSQTGCDYALEIIDKMPIEDVKRYLKELIKDNMVVGMEIIKGE